MIGFDYAFSFARDKFGLSTLTDHYETASGEVKSDMGYSPLGMGALTVGATIRDMSAAYATFANNGVYREARTYTKVYDSNGNLVLDNTQESRQILSEKTVNYMNYCLYNAANHGTGGAAIFNGQTIAGKTGTTSSNRDRWFCGYTGHYTGAVWVGYDQPEQINIGTNPAAQLWRKVMQPIHEGLPKQALYDASKFRSVGICLDSGKLATNACRLDARGKDERVVYVNVYNEDVPTESCDKHIQVEYCVTGGGVANDYCSRFPNTKVEARSLVKMTQAEVNEIRSAANVGLVDTYLHDGYVYYLDGEWHGFSGNSNKNTDLPYRICPKHNELTWEQHKLEMGDVGWEDDGFLDDGWAEEPGDDSADDNW